MKRVMIAAPGSGSGKTLITCALLRLLKMRGCDVSSFKCGPDYIDPMFHRKVLGITGGNLDSFFSDDEEIRAIMSRAGSEYAVLEGVMGIYDGIAGLKNPRDVFAGSCYDIARITDTPVILVMDVRGMGRTMVSVIKGILADDAHGLIRGIILNRITQHHYEQMSQIIRNALPEQIRLLGGIPSSPDIHLESRHLGLVMPDEIDDIMKQVDAAADLLGKNIDTEALMALMEEAGDNNIIAQRIPSVGSGPFTDSSNQADRYVPVLAVARDEAFCFYYEENLRMLREAGIAVREFSPLHDDAVPADADGILLGGGYPELYAEKLSGNSSMTASVRVAIERGMPSLAECGGFMYLLDELTDQSGCCFPMCGTVRGGSRYTGRLTRFGYIDISFPDGNRARGHEFHYSDSDNNGSDAHAVKPGSGREWECIHFGRDHIWGYPHLWYRSCPDLIFRFRDEMISYHKRHLQEAGSSGTPLMKEQDE